MWGVWLSGYSKDEWGQTGEAGLSQAPQMWDLVNVKPHPVVTPRDGAGAGGC